MEVFFIIILIFLNGLFAMAEMALISSKKSRIKKMVEEGNANAKTVQKLMEQPEYFLSTVQVGVTGISIIIGAFGESAIARKVEHYLNVYGPIKPYSSVLAFAITIAVITYLSLVIGELVPKRLALRFPERIAVFVAPYMAFVARFSNPLVDILSFSSSAILRLFQITSKADSSLSEDEIQGLINESAQAGLFEKTEGDIAQRALKLGDRQIKTIMTHRADIAWFNIKTPDYETIIRVQPHSHYPIADDSIDKIVGIVNAKDLLKQVVEKKDMDIIHLMKKPVFIPENTRVSKALEVFRTNDLDVVCVVDEYGSTQGILSFKDIMQTIIGEVRNDDINHDPHIYHRSQSMWIVDGMLNIEKFKKLTRLTELPHEKRESYQTVSGCIIAYLERIPREGEEFVWKDYTFKIIKVLENRVGRVVVSRTGSRSFMSGFSLKNFTRKKSAQADK